MNCVKGTGNTFNFHRARKDALHPSLDQARIDRETLNAMMHAIEEFFPVEFLQYVVDEVPVGMDSFAHIGGGELLD